MTAQSTPVRATRAKRTPMTAPAPAEASIAAPIVPAPMAEALPVSADVDHLPAGFVRKPFGARNQRLDNSERPGYHRHWFNDYPGRIQAALEAGYTHVKDKAGKNMCRLVGTAEGGGGLNAYRMEIPLEWYEADQKAKQARDEAKMDQIRRGIVAGVAPGEDGAYRPMNKAGSLGADIKMHGK